jgi:hypothetical protein
MAIKTSFKPADALKEYLLSGGEISLIESQISFGVQNLNAELGRLKKAGFIVKHRRVPMAKAIRRLNESCIVRPPESLPTREILITEYWLENV